MREGGTGKKREKERESFFVKNIIGKWFSANALVLSLILYDLLQQKLLEIIFVIKRSRIHSHQAVRSQE